MGIEVWRAGLRTAHRSYAKTAARSAPTVDRGLSPARKEFPQNVQFASVLRWTLDLGPNFVTFPTLAKLLEIKEYRVS